MCLPVSSCQSFVVTEKKKYVAKLHNCEKTWVHTYVRRPYIHTYIHTYVHTYIHTYIHMYIHTYIHTYAHMHIDVFWKVVQSSTFYGFLNSWFFHGCFPCLTFLLKSSQIINFSWISQFLAFHGCFLVQIPLLNSGQIINFSWISQFLVFPRVFSLFNFPFEK